MLLAGIYTHGGPICRRIRSELMTHRERNNCAAPGYRPLGGWSFWSTMMSGCLIGLVAFWIVVAVFPGLVRSGSFSRRRWLIIMILICSCMQAPAPRPGRVPTATAARLREGRALWTTRIRRAAIRAAFSEWIQELWPGVSETTLAWTAAPTSSSSLERTPPGEQPTHE